MSVIIEEINTFKIPENTKKRAIELYLKVEGKPQLCGDSDVVDNFWIETHTLGCRNAADCPEEDWIDEHFDIYNEYNSDKISMLAGAPEDGIFISITPQKE